MLRTILKRISNARLGFKRTLKNEVFDTEISRIVWIDMEMTGLNIDEDKIMEVACVITDSALNIVAEGPDIILHQPQEVLDNMHEWCRNQHGKSGLTSACFNANLSVVEAENTLLNFLEKHVTEKASPLAGNSVYMDRIFLWKHMPKVHDFLHYRIIDVSTVKELCRRWNVDLYKKAPQKEFTHRALSDIRESIAELRFYKENFLKL